MSKENQFEPNETDNEIIDITIEEEHDENHEHHSHHRSHSHHGSSHSHRSKHRNKYKKKTYLIGYKTG